MASINRQLEAIRIVKDHFDAVAIIRGGGGDLGLSCYNDYQLARTIATFPLPVMTGIGHSTNETVSEMVACINAITPTDLADLLIQRFHDFSVPVEKASAIITTRAMSILKDEKGRLMNTAKYLEKDVSAFLGRASWMLGREVSRTSDGTARFLKAGRQQVETAGKDLEEGIADLFENQAGRLSAIEKNISLLDPVNVLNRGYSITLAGGKAVRSVEEIREGTTLTTLLADGSVTSTATTVTKQETS